jgi:formylmethanofuran dehydrogenase subunit E
MAARYGIEANPSQSSARGEHVVSKPKTIWQYHVKELYDSTSDAGEDTVRCTQCGKRMETITACFSRYDGEPLCAACAQAGEGEE